MAAFPFELVSCLMQRKNVCWSGVLFPGVPIRQRYSFSVRIMLSSMPRARASWAARCVPNGLLICLPRLALCGARRTNLRSNWHSTGHTHLLGGILRSREVCCSNKCAKAPYGQPFGSCSRQATTALGIGALYAGMLAATRGFTMYRSRKFTRYMAGLMGGP